MGRSVGGVRNTNSQRYLKLTPFDMKIMDNLALESEARVVNCLALSLFARQIRERGILYVSMCNKF